MGDGKQQKAVRMFIYFYIIIPPSFICMESLTFESFGFSFVRSQSGRREAYNISFMKYEKQI